MAQTHITDLAKRLVAFRYKKGGDDGTVPVDDGNPLLKGRWLDSVEEYVGAEDDDLLSLVYDGTLLTKDITIQYALAWSMHPTSYMATMSVGLGATLLPSSTCTRLRYKRNA